MASTKINHSNQRVLVAECHSLMRRLLIEMLRQLGFLLHNIEEAKDAPHAFAAIYERPFDLLILDFFLGKLDGGDFTARIRQDTHCKNRRIPILLMTSMPDHQTVLKVKNAGVNEVLAKPIAPRDLYSHIYAMMVHPRPFIVSPNYVGPAHRKQRKLLPGRRLRKKNAFRQTSDISSTREDDLDSLLFG